MTFVCGENHPLWKGDDAGILAIHIAMRKELLKMHPLKCTKCGSTTGIEVASTNGHNYTRDPTDYTFLCKKCHTKLDHPDALLAKPRSKTNGGGATVCISKPNASVALMYGPNVSQGIGNMLELLNEYRRKYGPLENDYVARGIELASGPSVRGRR